jgi:hypothetical protein
MHPRITGALERLDLQGALVAVWEYLGAINKYFADRKPWVLAKEGKKEEAGGVLYHALEAVRVPEDLEFVLIVIGMSACAGLVSNLWRISRLFYAEHPRAGRWFYFDGQDSAFYGPRGINMANRWVWGMQALLILQVLLIRWILPQV